MNNVWRPIVLGLIVFVFGIFVAEQFDLYQKIDSLDKILHFVGGFVASWLTINFFSREAAGSPYLKKIILALAGAALIGVFWEFLEYSADGLSYYFYPFPLDKYLHIGTLDDTIYDLLFDVLGALLAALVIIRKTK